MHNQKKTGERINLTTGYICIERKSFSLHYLTDKLKLLLKNREGQFYTYETGMISFYSLGFKRVKIKIKNLT
jgi:hypothetical protein